MAGRRIEGSAAAPLRAMLDAARSLEAVVQEQERQLDGARSTARSTRVLIKLIEGWCIEYAIMNQLIPISQLRQSDRGDQALLATLREQLGQDEEGHGQEVPD